MPLSFPSFCDHFVAFKTAAGYVYISETIDNCQENIQNKEDILLL